MPATRLAFAPRRRARLAAALLAAAAASPAFAQPAACTARSAATVAPVVELYTSEGCSSCPPADRWLSRFTTEPNVVALAFHVDYWNRLGWKDRYASAAHTQRQSQQQAVNGARYSYTPQVVMDGIDRPDWPRAAPATPRPAARVHIELQRVGSAAPGQQTGYTAQVQALPGGPARLAAYWALTEQSHVTAVKAGENEGATLKHDFVVGDYRPVPAWKATANAPVTLNYAPPTPADAAHPRHVNLVVVDADTGRPVQALRLGC